MIGDEPFLVVNADNLWVDGPADTIKLLASRWDDATMDALLLVVPLRARAQPSRARRFPSRRARAGSPGVASPAGSRRSSIPASRSCRRAIIRDWPEGPFSTMVFWERAIAAGRAYGFVHQGLWFDVGTPPAIAKTEALLIDA